MWLLRHWQSRQSYWSWQRCLTTTIAHWPTTDSVTWYASTPDLAITLDTATVHVHPVWSPRHYPPTCSLHGGGLYQWPWQSRHCWCGAWQGQTLPMTDSVIRCASMPDLAITLGNATVHVHPVWSPRHYPPACSLHGGGLYLCPWQSRHCWCGAWRGQILLLAWRCCLLCSPQWHHLLTPLNPLMSRWLLLCCWTGGVLILSMIVAYHFQHGSIHAADIILATFVNEMAHRLPINWHPFFVVGVIGLACPMNVEDGLRWWDCCVLLEHFLLISVLWKLYWETCFLTKFASLGLPFLVPFGWLPDSALSFFCTVCLLSFWVSLSISHFSFPFMATPWIVGGVLIYSNRYPKYSRLTLLLYPSISCS